MAKQVTTIRLEEDVSRACRERFIQTGESKNALVDKALRELLGMNGTQDEPRDKVERELVRRLLTAWRVAEKNGRQGDVETLLRSLELIAARPAGEGQ